MATTAWWFPEKPVRTRPLRRTGVEYQPALPMGAQGKDGLGAPIKHSLCRIYKAGKRRLEMTRKAGVRPVDRL